MSNARQQCANSRLKDNSQMLKKRCTVYEIYSDFNLVENCEFFFSPPVFKALLRVTGHTHWSLSAVTHAPFHASVLRPASQVGPMHKTAGMGKLVNAALLSLINEACVNVCCAMLLLSQLVGPACVQARSSNP